MLCAKINMDEQFKLRLAPVKEIIRNTLKVGVGTQNAYDIMAVCQGFKNYNTAKGLSAKPFFRWRSNVGLMPLPIYTYMDIGHFDTVVAAHSAGQDLIKSSSISRIWELCIDDRPTGLMSINESPKSSLKDIVELHIRSEMTDFVVDISDRRASHLFFDVWFEISHLQSDPLFILLAEKWNATKGPIHFEYRSETFDLRLLELSDRKMEIGIQKIKSNERLDEGQPEAISLAQLIVNSDSGVFILSGQKSKELLELTLSVSRKLTSLSVPLKQQGDREIPLNDSIIQSLTYGKPDVVVLGRLNSAADVKALRNGIARGHKIILKIEAESSSHAMVELMKHGVAQDVYPHLKSILFVDSSKSSDGNCAELQFSNFSS